MRYNVALLPIRVTNYVNELLFMKSTALQLVIDRYWFFITDTDNLYVYVPITDIQNRYLFTVIK